MAIQSYESHFLGDEDPEIPGFCDCHGFQGSHQRSGSSGFAPVDSEPEELPQSEPVQAMEVPVEGEGAWG